MRKYLIIAAAACMSLAACNKDVTPDVRIPEPSSRASLHVSIAGSPATKATQTADEAAVNSLQVFVFNGDQIDVYGAVSNATAMTLDATTGERTVWAVVNAPDLKSITSMSELKAAVSQFTDNASDSFVMAGSKSETLSASSDVTVQVDRIAARVIIGKITRKFSADGLASLPADKFQIVRAYMADVAGKQNYGGTMTSYDNWISSSLGDGAILTSNALVYDKLSAAQSIAQDGSYEYSKSLYAYPNATEEDGASARQTRIVLECLIDGSHYTYPVIIPGILSNKSYEIRELVITRLGNPSDGDDDIEPGEDDPITSVEIPFGISVNDWSVVLLGEDGTVTI